MIECSTTKTPLMFQHAPWGFVVHFLSAQVLMSQRNEWSQTHVDHWLILKSPREDHSCDRLWHGARLN